MTNTPDFLLYAQHGWMDDLHASTSLAYALATPHTHIITPSLGLVHMLTSLEPLVQHVERVAYDAITRYPDVPMRVIGHSAGGIIWVEVLNRHPEWWTRIHSLVMIGSAVGGALYAQLLHGIGLKVGIAHDFNKNRRAMAEAVAQNIPTLAIVGDSDNGFDRMITVECTKLAYATWLCLPGLTHKDTRNHPRVADAIRDFWSNPSIAKPPEPDMTTHLIRTLRSVPGMSDSHRRHLHQSKVYVTFTNGVAIRTHTDMVGFEHVFITNQTQQCIYSGFVCGMYAPLLHMTLERIKKRDFQLYDSA